MLVGEVGTGEQARIFIERYSRAERTQSRPNAVLRLRPVLAQKEPILDFVMVGGTPWILEPARVVAGSRVLPFTPFSPLPRDARGRLFVRDGNAEVHVPGTSCTGDTALVCRGEDVPWREGFVGVAWIARRNTLTSGTMQPFFTVASFAPDQTVTSQMLPESGSDIAAIQTACSRTGMIVTSSGASEFLQAFEWTAAGTRPLTDRMSLPGRVVALWQSENPAEVSVVIKNPETGEHEASRVSVDCGR